MPRFKPGDRVRITSTASVCAGVEGVVEQATMHPQNITQLDSYTLRFWDEVQVFWDAQLEATENKYSKLSEPHSLTVLLRAREQLSRPSSWFVHTCHIVRVATYSVRGSSRRATLNAGVVVTDGGDFWTILRLLISHKTRHDVYPFLT